MNADLNYGSQENLYCWNLNGVFPRVGALQTNDKIVIVGVFNDYLILVRLLAN